MTTPATAKVVLTIPSLDPLLDPVSVSLVYVNDGGNTGQLVNSCPGLFNATGAGAANPIGHYLAASCDRGTGHCTIEVYDLDGHLDGSPHGSPVDGGTWTLTPPIAFGDYVEGVACCVNYRAAYGTDVEFLGSRHEGGGGTRPRARDRNRHYFGPLQTNCFTNPSDGTRVKFVSQFLTDCLADTKQVEVISDTGLDIDIGNQWNLQVWSRKNASTKPVFEYWTDDRPDYQRRRSDAPGTKVFLAA